MRRALILLALATALILAVPAGAHHAGADPGDPSYVCTNTFSIWCVGNSWEEHIYSTDAAQSIDGAGSADTLHGEGGNDRLHGNTGRDRLGGGTGSDDVWGGVSSDDLIGGDGNDSLYACHPSGCPSQVNEDPDYFWGGGGTDTIAARNNKRDVIDCGAGTGDTVYADIFMDDLASNCENPLWG